MEHEVNNTPTQALGAATPPTVPAPHPALDFAVRLDAILTRLTAFIFGRIGVLGDLTASVHNRVARARRHLVRLLTNLAAGRLPPIHPPRIHPPRIRAPDPDRNSFPRAPYIPQGHAWLVAQLGYHAAAYTSQLEFLLHDPVTQATIAAAPPRVAAALGRTLRPLCRLLGTTLPPSLRLPPRPPRPKRPSPPRPRRIPLPSFASCLPQRKPRDMPFLRARPRTRSA